MSETHNTTYDLSEYDLDQDDITREVMERFQRYSNVIPDFRMCAKRVSASLMTEIGDLIEDDLLPGRTHGLRNRDMDLYFCKGCNEERAIVAKMRELVEWFLRRLFVYIDRDSVSAQPRTDSSGHEFTRIEFKMRDFQTVHHFDMFVGDIPPYRRDPNDPQQYSTFYIGQFSDEEPLGAILAMLDRRTALLERRAQFTSGSSALPASAC